MKVFNIDWIVVPFLIFIVCGLVVIESMRSKAIYEEWGEPAKMQNGLAKPVQDMFDCNHDGSIVTWCGPIQPYEYSGKRWSQDVDWECVNKFGVKVKYDYRFIFSRTIVYSAGYRSEDPSMSDMPLHPDSMQPLQNKDGTFNR